MLIWIIQEAEAHQNFLILLKIARQNKNISCGPDTQARDIKVLVKGGYKVTAYQPFDLFPHTEHVENVILLRDNMET